MKSKKAVGSKELMYTILALILLGLFIIMYAVLKDKIFALLE